MENFSLTTKLIDFDNDKHSRIPYTKLFLPLLNFAATPPKKLGRTCSTTSIKPSMSSNRPTTAKCCTMWRLANARGPLWSPPIVRLQQRDDTLMSVKCYNVDEKGRLS